MFMIHFLLSFIVLFAPSALATEDEKLAPRGLLEPTRPYVDRSYGFTLDLPLHYELTGDDVGL